MKSILSLLALAALVAFAPLHAQTAAAPDAAAAVAAPTTPDPFAGLALLIPIISPLLVAGVKKLADMADAEIPGWLLPPLCTLFGVLLAFLQAASAGGIHGSTLLAGLVLGAAGSFVREFKDQVTKTATPSGVTNLLIFGLALSGLGLMTGCTTAQLAAAKPTALQLAPGLGAGLASVAKNQWPTKAPAIIQDVEAFNQIVILNGAPTAPANLTAWENAEAAKFGLTPADVSILDGALQTGVVALQGYVSADIKKAVGVNLQAVIAAFNSGMEKVVPLPTG